MIRSLKRSIGRLTTFSGRDSRSVFWPYAGCVVLLAMFGMGAVMSSAISVAFASQTGLPNFGLMTFGMSIAIFSVVALLAAAVARRLHDRGRSGTWGLMPLPFLTFGVVGFNLLAATFEAPSGHEPTLFFAIFFNNLIYMVTIVTLIVMLAGRSQPGPNRFGEAP